MVTLKDKLRLEVTVYGPYLRKDGRKHVILHSSNSNSRTMSYPKWLIEQHLGRFLADSETVDHINRDFTDDSVDNLQVLSKSAHSKLDAVRVRKDEIICIYCHQKSMKRSADRRHNAKLGKAGPFCSRKCSGKYGADIQNGRIAKLPIQDSPVSVTYRLDK